MKPKVILDIAFLGHRHDAKAASRGMQRVASYLFEGLLASDKCDLFFVATSHLAGAWDFLATRGISLERKLRLSPAQLRASRLGRRLSQRVHLSMANRSLPARAYRKILADAAVVCNRGEKRLTPAMLADADIFHSPHAPFPRAVREHLSLRKFLTLHDFIPLKHPDYFPSVFRPFMDRLLTCLTPQNFAFSVSEATRNDALNFSRIPPEHVFVTPLAADPKFFHPVTDAVQMAATRAQFGIPEAPYFLALSAHDRHKNFPHLISCFGELAEAGELTDVNLVIIGPNPGRNPEVAEALARFPRAKSRVVIAGFVPDEHLAGLYSGATAFLFPSLAEGFGMPPLEAMQCGAPVIASNTTSIPEVVGDAGILLPPTAKNEWCQAMLKIARHEDFRAELRQKSLRRCKLFSWDRFIAETLRGYQASLAMS